MNGLRNSVGSTDRGVQRAMDRARLKDRKNDPRLRVVYLMNAVLADADVLKTSPKKLDDQ